MGAAETGRIPGDISDHRERGARKALSTKYLRLYSGTLHMRRQCCASGSQAFVFVHRQHLVRPGPSEDRSRPGIFFLDDVLLASSVRGVGTATLKHREGLLPEIPPESTML